MRALRQLWWLGDLPTRVCTALAVIALGAGCRTGANYVDPEAPRYVGSPTGVGVGASARSDNRLPDTLRVVSFNIEFAVRVDSAIALLTSDTALRNADVLLLQEMDEPGTRRVAQALGMHYVYYPALFHLRTKRDFGNAVLSPWPIVDDHKIVLPHRAWVAGTHRIAVAATIRIGNTHVRAYSTHLGTAVSVEMAQRREQLATILDDAAAYPVAVIGGDMNSGAVGRYAVQAGFDWTTRDGPRTADVGRLDHIFLKGFEIPGGPSAGTVLEIRGSSDHRPVWALGVLR